MKLIAKDSATVSVLFVPDEVRPLSAVYWPAVFHAIIERYAIARPPSLEEAISNGAKFKTGRLGEIAIGELGVFNDGLSVTATDTDDAAKVVADLQGWLKSQFAFRDPVTVPFVTFQSELVVEFEKSPDAAFVVFKSFLRFMKDSTGCDMTFSGMRFAVPQGNKLSPEFLFEPRVNAPNDRRYFCKANLPTKKHVEALEVLERAFG